MKKIIYLFTLVIAVISCGTKQHEQIIVEGDVLWVNSTKVPCMGVVPMNCLEIQKGEVLETNKWELFYEEIEGFTFESGNIYKLKVKTEKLDPKDVPADASTVKYTLIKILSKKPDRMLRLHDIWVATSLNKKELKFTDEENRPSLELQIAERKIYGKGVCNRFFGTIKKVSEIQLEINDKIGSTLMACPKMEIETAFFEALPKVKTYKIVNNNLILFNGENTEIIRFKKVD